MINMTAEQLKGFPWFVALGVDHVLDIAAGPVQFNQLIALRAQGHMLGICGNWGYFTTAVLGWHKLVCALGPMMMTKTQWLQQIKDYVPASRYVFVGNDGAVGPDGVLRSADKQAAEEAGWEFILERDFKEGL